MTYFVLLTEIFYSFTINMHEGTKLELPLKRALYLNLLIPKFYIIFINLGILV